MGRVRVRQFQQQLDIPCRGRGLYDITADVRRLVRESGIETGMLNLFVRHTSCSLIVQENADPAVLRDMEAFMARLVPDGDPMFLHRDEGPDDMPAHIRMALTNVSLNIPVMRGAPALGVWQAVYLYEHRTHALRRHVIVHVCGEG